MPARPSVAELNATYDEPRSVMTNLVSLRGKIQILTDQNRPHLTR